MQLSQVGRLLASVSRAVIRFFLGNQEPAPVAPVITSTNTGVVAENATLNKALTASQTVAWTITGGLDQSQFELAGSILRWVGNGTKDFENPVDSNADNSYVVQVTATNQTTNMTATQVITIAVSDVLDVAPTITVSPTHTVAENTALAVTLTANQTVNWTISGGVDASKFNIAGNTLRWTANGTKDYEAPDDADANNVYLVQVTATNAASGLSATHSIAVTVTDVLDVAPTITSSPSATLAENTVLSKTLTADQSVNWSLTAGADRIKFELNGSVLRFAGNATKDFEAPDDADANNTYIVQVTATNTTTGLSSNQAITVTITDVLDVPPTITSSNSMTVAENVQLARTLTSDQSVTWAIVGGEDQARFELSGAVLRWAGNGTRDFENPVDADANNTYRVQVTATNASTGLDSSQAITVTVTDVLDVAPAITSTNTATNAENTQLAKALTSDQSNIAWTISGGTDQARFEINGTTLRWAGNSTKNYELPDDFDFNNVYVVQITATNTVTGLSSSQSITVTVTDVLDVAPAITSTNTASIPENTQLSKTLTADQSVTWSLTGGADQARFELLGAVLRWAGNGTKDFEAPNDADANNTYIVQVTATSPVSGMTSNQTITVTVTDVLDVAPVITSTNTGTNVENTQLAKVLTSNQTVDWSITGGADAADFELSAAILRWTGNGTRDYENPEDADTNNTYVVQVTATNATSGLSVSQTITITVTDVLDVAAVITSANAANNPEGQVLAHALTADQSVTWSIIGGADQARFEINGSTLRWLSNGVKDFEAPNDVGTNNTYIVQVRATATSALTTDQTITITVIDQNEVALNNVTMYYGDRTTPGDSSTVLLRNIPGLVVPGGPAIVSWRTSNVVANGAGSATSDIGGLLATNTATATARTPNPTKGNISNLSTVTLAGTSYSFTVTAVAADNSEATATITWQIVPDAFNIGDANGGDIISSRLATDTGGYDWLITTGSSQTFLMFQNIAPAGVLRTKVRYADPTKPNKIAQIRGYNAKQLDFEGLALGGTPAHRIMVDNGSNDLTFKGLYTLNGSVSDVDLTQSNAHAAMRINGATNILVEDCDFTHMGRAVYLGGLTTNYIENVTVKDCTFRHFYGDACSIGGSTGVKIIGNTWVAPMRAPNSTDHIDGVQLTDSPTNIEIYGNLWAQGEGNAGSIGFMNTSTLTTGITFGPNILMGRAGTAMNLGALTQGTFKDITIFLTASGKIAMNAASENDNVYNGAQSLVINSSAAPSVMERVFSVGSIGGSPSGWTKADNLGLNVAYTAAHQYAYADAGDNHEPTWDGTGVKTYNFGTHLKYANSFERSNNYDATLNPSGYDYLGHTMAEIRAYILDILTPKASGPLDLGGGRTIGAINLDGTMKTLEVVSPGEIVEKTVPISPSGESPLVGDELDDADVDNTVTVTLDASSPPVLYLVV